MAFKMKGSPAKMGTIQGTAGHSSALKMKMEKDAAAKLKREAAAKMKSPVEKELVGNQDRLPEGLKAKIEAAPTKKTYKEAYKDADKDKYKTQEEFNKAADDWWASDAGQKKAASDKKFSHRLTKINKSDEGRSEIKTADEKDTRTDKEKKKAAKSQKKHENKIGKMDKKYNEREENRKVQDAKRSAKYAKEYFGKGSAEHATSKYEAAVAKGEDLSGAGGGKRAVFFGNLRRKWNQKKQDRLKGKADRLSQEKSDAEDKAIKEYNETKNKKSPATKKDDRKKLNKLVEKRTKIRENVKERDEKDTKFLHKTKDKIAAIRLKKIQKKINKNTKAKEDLKNSKKKDQSGNTVSTTPFPG